MEESKVYVIFFTNNLFNKVFDHKTNLSAKLNLK